MENQTQLDPQVVNLAKAIRSTESGGNFQAQGKSGEYGAYQFMPATWKAMAKEHLGDENADIKDPLKQNEVAYKQIKKWKDQGYNPGQIASMWNSGKPNWEGNVGTNARGVAYDTPAYVNNVTKNYQELKNGIQTPSTTPETSQGAGVINTTEVLNQLPVETQAPEQPGLVQSMIQGIASPFLKTATTAGGILGGLYGLGKTAVGGITGNEQLYREGIQNAQHSLEGQPTDFGYFGKVTPIGYTPTGEKMNEGRAALEAVGVGTELASNFLGGGAGVNVAKQGIKQGLIQGGKAGIKGGLTAGLGYGLGTSLQEQAQKNQFNLPEVAAQTAIGGGLGAATGGILGGATGAIGSTLNKTMPSRIVQNRVDALTKIEDRNTPIRNFIKKQEAKGVDIKKIISETDLLHGTVDNTGAVRTQAAIKDLNAFIKPQEDVISNALKNEGKSIPLIQIEEKLKNAINESNIKGGNKITALKNADREIRGLTLDADANGNIPLSIVHDAKVNKYSTINYLNPKVKQSDKLIAKTLKGIVEDNTTSVDVKKLNDELSQHYATLGFLEKLDGKIVEGGQLGKYFAQMFGAAVGSHFGPLGTIVGGEASKAAQGKMMQGTFGKKIGKSLTQSPEMQKAIQAAKAQSKNLGSLKTIQSKTIKPTSTSAISNIVKQKTPKVKGFKSAEVPEKLAAVKSSPNSENVNMNDLISIKKESQSTLKNTSSYIEDALAGKGEARKPLTAIQLNNGKKLIVDGNATYQSLKGKVNDVPVETINPINPKTKQPYTDSQISDAVKLYQRGSENVKAFDKIIKQMSADVGVHQLTKDTTYKVKPLESILEKKYARGETINDLNRDTIIIKNNDPKQIAAVVNWLRSKGAKDFDTEIRPGLKNRFETNNDGYRDVNYQFKMPDGSNYELQMMGENMAKAKQEVGHYIYNITEKDIPALLKSNNMSKKAADLITNKWSKISNKLYNIAYKADANGEKISSFSNMLSLKEKADIDKVISATHSINTERLKSIFNL